MDTETRAVAALKSLLGFAERNLKRAEAAHKDALTAYRKACDTVGPAFVATAVRVEVKIQEAREHEAHRVFLVIRDQVQEALR